MNLSKDGLKHEKVRIMRQKYGANVIAEKKQVAWISILINQITNPLIYILFFAVVVNMLLGELIESIVIGIVILINTILSFFQEFKAMNTLDHLKKYLKEEVTVIRDGKEKTVLAEDIVVGDRVVVKPGDAIASDGVLIRSEGVQVNESVLTGESIPVSKYPVEDQDVSQETNYGEESQVFKGTSVNAGVGEYIVLHVGSDTRFGEIADLLQNEKEQLTPLQKKIRSLSVSIGIFVVLVSILFLAIRTIQDEPLEETFTLSIALAVSAIPEALIISLTVVLALGMNRLLKDKALVRKPVIAETLGSVTTLCIDKTGTLTKGEMKVENTKFTNESIAFEALIAANNRINTIDEAVLQWIQKNNITADFSKNEFIKQKPFNSTDKYSITIHEKQMYIVGAPEQLLEKSNLSEKEKNNWKREIIDLSKQGKRIIGVGYKARNTKMDIQNLHWIGYVVFNDPVRDEAKEALKTCMGAGISVKVITGDSKETAMAVMNSLGFEVNEVETISGNSLQDISDDVLKHRIKNVKLFYRITPEQKYRLVKILQELGESVGMMGDGVNDAPALKRADIGIVVNNATDVSKDTADMILLNSSFNTLVNAVEEGRVIFENMKKVVTYLLADSFSTVILIGGSFILGLPLPITALQILFTNLASDSLPDIGLAFEPKEKDVMKPRNSKDTSILNGETISLIVIIGVIVNIGIFFVFIYLYGQGYPIDEIRSFVFMLLALDSFLYVFSIRSLSKNIWNYPLFNNQVLNLGIISGALLVLGAFTIPVFKDILDLVYIRGELIVLAFALAFTQIVLIELTKFVFFRYQKVI